MEVVLEGILQRCKNATQNNWEQYYFVFKRDFSKRIFLLEYYKDNNWKKQTVSGVYNLYPEFSVLKINLKNCFAFELTIGEQVHIFSANTESLRKQWVGILLEAVGVKVFNVMLIGSPPTANEMLKNFQGVIELHVTKTSVMLLANDLSKITWRFGTIRRYNLNNFIFTLEIGKQSDTGEGIFQFECNRSIELFDIFVKYLKERINTKLLMKSPNTQQIYDIKKPLECPVNSSLSFDHINSTPISLSQASQATEKEQYKKKSAIKSLPEIKSELSKHPVPTPRVKKPSAFNKNAQSDLKNTQDYTYLLDNPEMKSNYSVYNVCDQEVTLSSLNTYEIEEQKYVSTCTSTSTSVVHKINNSVLNKSELNGDMKKLLGFNSTPISLSSQTAEEEQYKNISAVQFFQKKIDFTELPNCSVPEPRIKPVPAPRVKKSLSFDKNAALSQIDLINAQEYNHKINSEMKSNQIIDDCNHLSNMQRSIDFFGEVSSFVTKPDAYYDYPIFPRPMSNLPIKSKDSSNLIGSKIYTQSFNSLKHDYIEIPCTLR